jgi:hypothetical protein
MGVGIGVIVGVGDDFSARSREPGVPRVGQSAVRGADQRAGIERSNRRGVVGRSVVHDDDFVIGVFEPLQPFEAVPDGARAVVRADHHRYARPREARCERRFGERLAHRVQGRLGDAVGACQTEAPVLDVVTVPVPLVRPRENEGARGSGGHRRTELPIEGSRLRALAVAHAVQTQLAHDERPVAGEVLQPSEIRLEPFLGFEVHVEAQEVEEREREVLRGRIVDVRDETGRVLGFHHAVQVVEIPLYAACAQPARQRRRDLVPECVAQQRGMVGTRAHLTPKQRVDVRCAPAVDEIPDVLLGGEPHHHPEAVAPSRIEQRPRRCRMRDPHRVEPGRRHLRHVALDHREVVILVAFGVRLERAVGHSAHVELLIPDEEELSSDARACGRAGGVARRRVRRRRAHETRERRRHSAVHALPRAYDWQPGDEAQRSFQIGSPLDSLEA